MLPEPPVFVEFLAPYAQPVQDLARGLRKGVLELLPPCIETIWDAINTVGVAFGFTEKNADHFIHLATYTKYVNIGFSNGASLHDPEGRLQGSGSRIRHFKLTALSDLEDPYLMNLIRQAHEGAPRTTETLEPRSMVRVMEGPKRRPRPSA